MKKKVISLSVFLIVFSFIITSLSITSLKSERSDVSEISAEVLYAGNEEEINRSSDFNPDFYISDITGGTDTYTTTSTTSSSGLLDAAGSLFNSGSSLIGSLGDIVGGVIGNNLGNSTTAAITTTTNYVPTTVSVFTGNTLAPVPAASQTTKVETTVQITEAPGETVDYAATSNPYTKPTSDFTAGDEDETIKWIQWIFIYTHYGLSDNGITGVLDEDTVAVVKKLQQERGLTVDGNINEDVVNKAELLYFEYTLGPTTEQSTAVSVTEALASDANGKQDGGNGVITIIMILAVLWAVTVAVILIIFFLRKKNAKKDLEKEDTTTTPTENAEEKTTGVRSMSDLFEDAGEK